ncbi:30S ribosomal protein S8 [Candidatus Peregrinibacteria bacterium]|nr:30S ribosomal protein S8 [Candidatus Peregrinibacteria bacterium]
MHTDPIADLLNRIKNAGQSKHEMVTAPYSKQKHAIAELLEHGKWISKVAVIGEGYEKELHITLNAEIPALHVKRISKPGRRVYIGNKEIPRVLNNLGIAILSTSKGLMTGKEAKKQKLGGELICEIY